MFNYSCIDGTSFSRANLFCSLRNSIDHLDLGRVGIIPSPKFLSEEASKLIDEAFDWSTTS